MKLPPGILITLALFTAALIQGAYKWGDTTPEPPYQFPHPELAALDRDAQARFAETPVNEFGIERMSGQHNMYVPQSPVERATIKALKKKKMEVAFYVMSRRSWREERGPEGYYPVQGPVYVTRTISQTPPRLRTFQSYSGRRTMEHPLPEPAGIELINPQNTRAPNPSTRRPPPRRPPAPAGQQGFRESRIPPGRRRHRRHRSPHRKMVRRRLPDTSRQRDMREVSQ